MIPPISNIPRLFASLAAWICLCSHAAAEATARMSSRFLTRGEQALLEICFTGGRPDAHPVIPVVNGVDIRPSGTRAQARLLTGRRIEHVFEYLVSSYEPGRHVLPPVKVISGGVASNTAPLEFSVFNPDELQWSEAAVGTTRFRYASAFRILNPAPYAGETTAVEIKLFVPRSLFVEDWGIPDFVRDGVTAWRFQPSAMRGQVNLLGMPYVTVAYPSTLTPVRTGTVSIGPAKLRLITTEVVMDGILRRIAREVNLTVPGLEIQSSPLPDGAPAGFENAVGSFQIRTSSGISEALEGDPVPVEIVVSGSGNLDTLRPPVPVDATGWKLYDATAEPRGDERREISGRTVFRQFLRPLEPKTSLPAFQLVYFDPDAREYRTALSEPIPLKITPAMPQTPPVAAPPQAAAKPVERMTDILGLLEPASLTLPATPHLPAWSWHALATMAALALAAKALWMRYAHLIVTNPAKRELKSGLKQLVDLEKSGDDVAFLLAAGRFIESRSFPSLPPEAAGILAERDNRCFRRAGDDAPPLGPERRAALLRVLRTMTNSIFAMWIAATITGRANANDAAAREAYHAARYDEAITLWLAAADYASLSPDVLYHIGNACYRAGSPGHAALYYRRALSRDPSHQESRQNLRFIERKYGAITIQRPEFQYALARVPLAMWKNLVWAGLWLAALSLLVFPASCPRARIRVAAFATLVIAPLLAASGALGWHYFPDDAEFAPQSRQAVILGTDTVLHSEASRTSPEVIDAPPGSLCEVIRESGRWAYVAFATRTRGWVPIEEIGHVEPSTTPTPPRIRKPKADGKSARIRPKEMWTVRRAMIS
jgi:tetratricopeptide (TPR) repeat protein